MTQEQEIAFTIAQKLIRLEDQVSALMLTLQVHASQPPSAWLADMRKAEIEVRARRESDLLLEKVRGIVESTTPADVLFRALNQEVLLRNLNPGVLG